MNSKVLSTTTAGFLAVAGIMLLFASDSILPAVDRSIPGDAFWVGQSLAAALLGLAVLNYFHRFAVLGGIYGRPVVMANATFFFVAGVSMLQFVISEGFPAALTIVTVILLLFAGTHGYLMFKGPFRDEKPSGKVGKPRG